jgi:hypothetical protein
MVPAGSPPRCYHTPQEAAYRSFSVHEEHPTFSHVHAGLGTSNASTEPAGPPPSSHTFSAQAAHGSGVHHFGEHSPPEVDHAVASSRRSRASAHHHHQYHGQRSRGTGECTPTHVWGQEKEDEEDYDKEYEDNGDSEEYCPSPGRYGVEGSLAIHERSQPATAVQPTASPAVEHSARVKRRTHAPLFHTPQRPQRRPQYAIQPRLGSPHPTHPGDLSSSSRSSAFSSRSSVSSARTMLTPVTAPEHVRMAPPDQYPLHSTSPGGPLFPSASPSRTASPAWAGSTATHTAAVLAPHTYTQAQQLPLLPQPPDYMSREALFRSLWQVVSAATAAQSSSPSQPAADRTEPARIASSTPQVPGVPPCAPPRSTPSPEWQDSRAASASASAPSPVWQGTRESAGQRNARTLHTPAHVRVVDHRATPSTAYGSYEERRPPSVRYTPDGFRIPNAPFRPRLSNRLGTQLSTEQLASLRAHSAAPDSLLSSSSRATRGALCRSRSESSNSKRAGEHGGGHRSADHTAPVSATLAQPRSEDRRLRGQRRKRGNRMPLQPLDVNRIHRQASQVVHWLPASEEAPHCRKMKRSNIEHASALQQHTLASAMGTTSPAEQRVHLDRIMDERDETIRSDSINIDLLDFYRVLIQAKRMKIGRYYPLLAPGT